MIKDRFRGYLPIIVDVETAGFNCQTDALLEAAAVIIDMDDDGLLYAKETIDCHIEPFAGANLEAAALEFTGIDPADPEREAISERDALDQLFKPIRKALKANECKRAILVGHNAAFDLNFINAAVASLSTKAQSLPPFFLF